MALTLPTPDEIKHGALPRVDVIGASRCQCCRAECFTELAECANPGGESPEASLALFEKAVSASQSAIEYSPAYYSGWFNKGSALYRTARFPDAVDCYEKALRCKPPPAAKDGLKKNLAIALQASGGMFGG